MAAFRVTGAWWFLPLMLVLGTALPLLNEVTQSGYGVADLSGAGIGLAYNVPLLAAVTAYAAKGWAQTHAPLRARRRGLIVTRGLWPLLIGGPVVGCVTVCSVARTVPATWPAWALMATYFAVLAAGSVLGLAMSWALPVVVAVPSAALLCFAWMNYPPATSSRELHQLTPMIDGFAMSAQPSRTAVAAILAVSGVMTCGVLLIFVATRWEYAPRWLAAPTVLMILLLASFTGWQIVAASSQPLNLMAAEPRSSPLTCARDDAVEICLWPESRDQLEAVGQSADRLNGPLAAWGQPTIDYVTVRPRGSRDVSVDVSRGLDQAGLAMSLAAGYIDHRVGCVARPDRGMQDMVLVLALASGARVENLADRANPDTLKRATTRFAQSSDQTSMWINKGIERATCRPTP